MLLFFYYSDHWLYPATLQKGSSWLLNYSGLSFNFYSVMVEKWLLNSLSNGKLLFVRDWDKARR